MEECVSGDDVEKLYSEKRRVALTVDLQWLQKERNSEKGRATLAAEKVTREESYRRTGVRLVDLVVWFAGQDFQRNLKNSKGTGLVCLIL